MWQLEVEINGKTIKLSDTEAKKLFFTLLKAFEKDLIEMLAHRNHDSWSNWMKYLFSRGEDKEDGTWIMPKWAVDRWKRQMETLYGGLSEKEKESNRIEAKGYIDWMKTL